MIIHVDTGRLFRTALFWLAVGHAFVLVDDLAILRPHEPHRWAWIAGCSAGGAVSWWLMWRVARVWFRYRIASLRFTYDWRI